jgi:uncharacterized protein (TIGR02996 family)
VTSQRRAEWTGAEREAAAALLAKANGRRTTRLLTMTDVERCAEAALQSELGFSWVSAGAAPDARSVTSICLCVSSGVHLTVGLAAGHGEATPASAWPDITSWDRYRDSSNASACLAWAGRRRADRLTVSVATAKGATSASRDELFAAVLADPRADGPRLVLADWLMERGDPRGEFISIQCGLARGAPSGGEELREREATLLREHQGAWLGGLGSDLVEARFRRGFVERAVVHDSRALPLLDACLHREPVTELIVASSHAIDSERFATLPWLERLDTLEFRAPRPNVPGPLSRDRLEHVLASRRLRKLTRLALVGVRLGDEGLRSLAEHGGKTFPALECLHVEDDAVTDKGVAPLAASRWAARFTELSLANNELRVDGAEALADSRSPGRLTRLWLGGNQLGDEGSFVIARAPRFRTLEDLSLPRNRIGPQGLAALLESDSLATLRSLDLTGNPLGAAGWKRHRARFG